MLLVSSGKGVSIKRNSYLQRWMRNVEIRKKIISKKHKFGIFLLIKNGVSKHILKLITLNNFNKNHK